METNTNTTAYLCPQGHLRTDKPGTCPEHGVKLEAASYRCPNCGYAALQDGECAQCKAKLQKA